jgi:hypothetical protein
VLVCVALEVEVRFVGDGDAGVLIVDRVMRWALIWIYFNLAENDLVVGREMRDDVPPLVDLMVAGSRVPRRAGLLRLEVRLP